MDAFVYYGHFYNLCVDDVVYHCRSTLEIARTRNLECARAADEDPSQLLDRRPDALFVMLNPGGSRPCGHEPNNIVNPRDIYDDARQYLVATDPDDTQQAIKIVMSRKGFDHVRVLNLFDIREPDIKLLRDTVRSSYGVHRGQRLSEVPEMKSYSIFSGERCCELRSRLNIGSPIVVAAWSTEDRLRLFFEKCYDTLTDLRLRIYGWQAGEPEQRKYYHPARNENWAEYIVRNWPVASPS